MTDTSNGHNVIGSGGGITMAQRPNDRNVQRPRDLPGIVIFLHGVNDPGANYATVEDGLCAGLCDRLDRSDIVTGSYGAQYKEMLGAKAKGKANNDTKIVLGDPDTYLYRRNGDQAHSVFVPFYWGYRARPEEILKDKQTGQNAKLRGQYQDIRGNRLDAHFGKAGGMFNNATDNIPDMYGPGFKSSFISRRGLHLGMSNYQFAGNSPDRHYYVLAAERLAMLVAEMRHAAPDETINIMAHSQGTIITLLAQALLSDRGERCADCVVLVDSPYGLNEHLAAWAVQPDTPRQTVQAKVNTLVNIVKVITGSKHPQPPLEQLVSSDKKSGGRAGYRWTPKNGTRKDLQNKDCVFPERDNRGRVYLYFCPEDATVDLPNVKGIGTYGIEDSIAADDYYWDGNHTRPQSMGVTVKAMDELRDHNFRQRVWSKQLFFRPKTGPMTQQPVGVAPGYVDIPDIGRRYINGDELFPSFLPQLYGGEAKRGTPTKAGLEAPDAVTQDLALGNMFAKLQWIRMPATVEGNTTEDSLMRQFNAGKDVDHQTSQVRIFNGPDGFGGYAEREETPDEARTRMSQDPSQLAKNDSTGILTKNSYHSAILRDPSNHRWVTAMDVAIGQAKSLDDKDWQDLWLAIADWKTPLEDISGLKKFNKGMTERGKELITASCDYYSDGTFPSAKLVSLTPPSLVVSQTRAQRGDPPKPPPPPVFNWNFNGL